MGGRGLIVEQTRTQSALPVYNSVRVLISCVLGDLTMEGMAYERLARATPRYPQRYDFSPQAAQ